MNIQMYDNEDETQGHNYTVALSVLRRDRNGHPTAILCTRSDVTKELLRQIEVKNTLLRYQAIFNSVMVDMVAYDAQGYIVDINQKALSALGVDLQVIKDQKISIKDVVGEPNLDVEHFEHMYLTQIYQGEDERPLHRMLKRNKLYYELQLTPVRDAEGKLLAIYGTGRNVTELAESYQHLLQDIHELQKANDEVSEYIQNIDYVLKVGGIKMVKYDLTTHTLILFNEANHARLSLTQTRMLNLIDPKWKKSTERFLNNMDNKTATHVHLDVRTSIRRQGHLLHLLAYYELFTGDRRYHREGGGWDFVWKDGRRVHYDVEKLIEVTVEQMRKGPNGGVTCEPGLMFFACNSHPHVALSVFSKLGYGDWSADAARWEKWALSHYLSPAFGGGALNLVYHVRGNFMYPRGQDGFDGWSLLWYEAWASDRRTATALWRRVRDGLDWSRLDGCGDGTGVIGCCDPRPVSASVASVFLAAAARACSDPETAERLERAVDAKYLRREGGLFWLDLNREWRIGATAMRIISLAESRGSRFRDMNKME